MAMRWMLLFAIGCTAPPPHATAADAQRANVALAELQDGRALLIKKCDNCHRAPQPADRRAAEWPKQVAEMTERANVDPRQAKLITLYLVALSK
jgi:cytochrome c5